MLPLISFLIFLFFIIITYQLFLAHFGVKEGLDTYQNYDTSDPNNAMILAQQNAGNIAVMKETLDGLSGVKEIVTDMSGNITSLQTQVDGLVQAQQDYISQSGVTEPPAVTGAIDEEEGKEDADA